MCAQFPCTPHHVSTGGLLPDKVTVCTPHRVSTAERLPGKVAVCTPHCVSIAERLPGKVAVNYANIVKMSKLFFFVLTLNSPFISQLEFEGWTVKVKVKDAKVAKSLFVSDSNVWVCVWSDWHQLQTTVLQVQQRCAGYHQLQTTVLQVQQRCAGCDLHSSLKTFLL